MKKTISAFRMATLMTLSMVGILFLLGEENDKNVVSFFFHVIFDKTLAILIMYVTYLLYRRWVKTDKWIKAYHDWCNIDEEWA